jgi:Glycosyl transferase family 2
MKLISVIVCTHNPRLDYLRRTIGGLKRQTLSPEQWELLLIDKASDEILEGTCDLSWHRTKTSNSPRDFLIPRSRAVVSPILSSWRCLANRRETRFSNAFWLRRLKTED